jgi:TolB protein
MNISPSQGSDRDRLTLAIKEKEFVVSPEDTVKIQLALINDSPDEDYVDILVKGVPSEWTTIEKPVVHVPAGETVQFSITVQPPPVPESRVGQYPLDVKAVSQRDPEYSVTARSLLTVAAYQSMGRIGVLLGSIYFSISPGSSIDIPIILQNRGTQQDGFQLNVEGISPGWVSTNSAFTKLEPGASKEVQITLKVPRTTEADAGRTPFKIRFTSQNFPDQKTVVECILTIATFSKFTAALKPESLEAGQNGSVVIDNEGNTNDSYNLKFISSGNMLIFEKGIPVSTRQMTDGTQEVELKYGEIPSDETFQVEAGKRGIYPFRSGLRSRPIFGGEASYPYTIEVTSTSKKSTELPGKVVEKGLVPAWLIPAFLVGSLILCLAVLLPISSMRNSARATQTAMFNQTQAALMGQEDPDGDGLTSSKELEIGSDPTKADTDDDQLLDGEEFITYLTNPLAPDSDTDGLRDGEEIRTYTTNPLNPDTDADLLNDGDEVARGTDPKNTDTDQDGLGDGTEVNIGTDPLVQDTDKDLLMDGLENQTCPHPLQPDTDNDGIIDGNDLNPCDSNNPSMTATAIAAAPTLPTGAPTNTQPAPSSPQAVTPTASLPGELEGIVLFESNRSGNPDIFALNLENQSMLQLTDNSAVDTQAALAPDQLRVVYVSNQNGNNEIFLGGLDRRAPVNLTNNSTDDQQPTWSPDGNWIAFTSNRDGNQEIYIMRSDGSEVRRLTNNPTNDFAPTWFSVPRLLGTEEWIAFTSNRDGNQEIYKIKPDGTGLENLTKNPANDYSPSGTADLGMIAFVTDRDGNPEVYVMIDSGGAPTNVTKNPSQDLEPALSPDGEWIIFTSGRDGNMEIYVTDVVGNEIYNLTRNISQDRYPDW